MLRKLLVFTILYLLILLAPLVLGFVLPDRTVLPARPWRDDLASGLGMIAFGAVLLEFLLLGRFRPVSRILGSDVAMQAHQLLARTALLFLLLHPLLYSLWGRRHLPWDASYALALRVSGDSWGLLTGLLALGGLLAMVLISVYRNAAMCYERWRLGHSLLALAVLALGLHHALAAGRYAQLVQLRWFWVVLASLALASWLSVYALRPLLQAQRPMRLSRVAPLAHRIWAVELVPAGGKPLRYTAGQFVWLKLGGLAPYRDHPFSISSAPRASGVLCLAVKEAGDFTRALPQMEVGTPAYVDGPHGNFRLPDEAPAIIMVAGGIGIAPFLGVLSACADDGEQRPIRLIYADRDPTQLVDVAAVCGTDRLADFRQILMVEAPPQGWQGLVGRLDASGLAQALAQEDVGRLTDEAHFMVCGPGGMMDAVECALQVRGVPMARVQSEHFQYDFGGRSPRARALRRGWLTLSAAALLLAALVTALA